MLTTAGLLIGLTLTVPLATILQRAYAGVCQVAWEGTDVYDAIETDCTPQTSIFGNLECSPGCSQHYWSYNAGCVTPIPPITTDCVANGAKKLANTALLWWPCRTIQDGACDGCDLSAEPEWGDPNTEWIQPMKDIVGCGG